MKERPILFNGEMVRAILDGRKTQTRRVVKPAPEMVADHSIEPWEGDPGILQKLLAQNGRNCPFGQPGDLLWVRETHAIVPRTAYTHSAGVEQVLRPHDNHDAAVFREGWERSKPGRWRPSIHMPRWASRITLEITDVRVERLQDISEDDARSEGCNAPLYVNDNRGRWGPPRGETLSSAFPSAKHWFSCLWESINGAGSWAKNPWVWVVEFKSLEAL